MNDRAYGVHLALSQTMLQLRLSGATTPALPKEARVTGPA